MENRQTIGTLKERSLHAAIKCLYDGPRSRHEVAVDGYVVDVEKDGQLIEIQTRGFAAIRSKLFDLLKKHPVKLVYPVPSEKWLIRQTLDGTEISRRRSPKQLGFADVFDELVSIPTFILHKNFSLEVLLTREEEIRVQDGKGSWRRRGWSSVDRKLVEVLDRRTYAEPQDFLHLIPDTIEVPFSTKTLGETANITKSTAQKMTYCMRKMGTLKVVGKDGNAFLYSM